MSIVRCPEGHFYDNGKFEKCPHCSDSIKSPPKKFVPTPSAAQPQATVALKLDEPVTDTVKEKTNEKENLSLEEMIRESKRSAISEEPAKTVGLFYDSEQSLIPAVGWVVVIEGPDKGKDYRIISGRNYIGRSKSMDIALENDNAVSSDKHAAIVYDPNNNEYILGAAESRELIYINNKVLVSPVELNYGDIIKLGNTQLIFIPLCSEKFKW